MKSKRNSRSIPRGDHDELEIFLEIRLICFTNRSKVEEQEEKYMFLKRIFGPILRPFDAVVGRLVATISRKSWPTKEKKSFTTISPRMSHDFGSIKLQFPRSP